MEKICNVSFGEENWSQASLPIRYAGPGLCSAADLSLPCFQSSSHACARASSTIYFPLLEILYGDINDAIDEWSEHHDSSPLQRKYKQPGMISPAEIHSIPYQTPITLGTTAGYLPHKKATSLPVYSGQKRSQLPVLETCSALMSSVLQLASELVPKSLKAQNSAAAKLLMSWESMASPLRKMQAASQGIQPSTPSSRGH